MDYHQVTIDPTAKIAKNTSIVGNVTIGADCTILFNAAIRGDEASITIGSRSNVQENCCIHASKDSPCSVGNDVTVGHGAILHGCTIESETLIGMGSIVLDKAVIGKRCIVGAGALVTGGVVIPGGMLAIGSPAKAVRPLTEEEIASIRHSSEEYVALGKEMVDAGILYAKNTLPGDMRNICIES